MTVKHEFPMTRNKLAELREELKQKLEVEKPALAARLKAAIEMGDLSENAEYLSAKEDQGFLEGRIQELQNTIRGAVIIAEEDARGKGIIQLGSHVSVMADGEDEAENFQIVGQVEANPLQGKISNESPVGMALLGRKVGEEIRVQTPQGEMRFKVISIE
jgi:transcription elongation factor GreA